VPLILGRYIHLHQLDLLSLRPHFPLCPPLPPNLFCIATWLPISRDSFFTETLWDFQNRILLPSAIYSAYIVWKCRIELFLIFSEVRDRILCFLNKNLNHKIRYWEIFKRLYCYWIFDWIFSWYIAIGLLNSQLWFKIWIIKLSLMESILFINIST